MLTALLVMVSLALLLGIVLGYSALKFKVEGDPLVARIDAARIEAAHPPNLASAIRVWLFVRERG